jgi:hypothetical protein
VNNLKHKINPILIRQDFAKRYPDANIIGTDLSLIQPPSTPENCTFLVEDAEKDWAWDRKFDYIHGRMVMVGIRNWLRLLQQSFKALKPGGWIEIQDLNFPIQCDDGTAAPDSPLMKWSDGMIEGAGKLGVDLTSASRLPQLLREAGFIDVLVEHHLWPLNSWQEDDRGKMMGELSLENFLKGLQGFTAGFYTRGLGWEMQAVQKLVIEVETQAKNPNSHAGIPIPIIWARKPE